MFFFARRQVVFSSYADSQTSRATFAAVREQIVSHETTRVSP